MEKITSEFQLESDRLEKEIINIELKQMEIQNHISDLENANTGLKKIIQIEQDTSKKAKYYGAIRNNIELITKLYSAYKDFESVKFSYRKEISGLTQSKNRILYVDLPRIGSSSGPDELLSVFKALTEAMKDKELADKISIGDNEEYKL